MEHGLTGAMDAATGWRGICFAPYFGRKNANYAQIGTGGWLSSDLFMYSLEKNVVYEFGEFGKTDRGDGGP